jgi:hypothetical protein
MLAIRSRLRSMGVALLMHGHPSLPLLASTIDFLIGTIHLEVKSNELLEWDCASSDYADGLLMRRPTLVVS